MNATIELLFMIASLIMICIIFISVYSFRRQRGIQYLLGLIGCRFIYVGGVIMEKSVFTLAEKLFFRNIHQTAQNLMVPLFILFVLEWIAPTKTLKPGWKIFIISAFSLWSAQMWFDAELNWIYRSIELVNGHLVTTRSAYSLSFTMFCFLLLAVSMYALFQYIRNIRNDLRKPGMWVLFLSSFSAVLEVLKFANPQWLSWLLPLTVYCGFIGTLMLVIFLRSRFFSLVPFARNLVLDTLQESIVIADASGKVIDSNKPSSIWFARLGYPTVTDRKLAELLARWPNWLALCEAMQQGSVEIEASMEGERKQYRVNVYPLLALQKQRGSISLIVDITEKQRDLEQIARLNHLKDQLIAVVSHDIRGPLALQYQLIALLEEDMHRFSADHREVISQLGGQIRNTLGMSTNLLEWFRSQREDMALRPQYLDLSAVVEECIHLQHIHSAAKLIQITHSVSADLQIYADREALGFILRNLLSNAVKFTHTGGSIHIDAELSGDTATISIRDNGIGIEEDRLRRLLEDEPLRSLEGTAGERGSGLGLLVTRQFIIRSGGTMTMDSQPGKGSVFQFTMKGGHHHESTTGRR